MKIALQLLLLITILTACSTVPSDARIQQKIVGTWKAGRGTTENRPDGSYVHQFRINVTNEGMKDLTEEGTWRIENGYLITTITNEPWPDADHAPLRFKVVSIDDHKLVVSQADRIMDRIITNAIVVYRQ